METFKTFLFLPIVYNCKEIWQGDVSKRVQDADIPSSMYPLGFSQCKIFYLPELNIVYKKLAE